MRRKKKLLPCFIFSYALLCLFSFSQTVQAEGVKLMDRSYKVFRLAEDTLFPGCNGAAVGVDGALYVVHVGDGTTTRIDLATLKAANFVPPYAGASMTDDITSDDKGNFYVAGWTPIVGEVYRVDPKGMKTVIAKGFIAPNGIQYNKRTGRLFMSECFQANRVFELDPAGIKEPKLLVKEKVISVPEGFDFDPDTDDLIIPDLRKGQILRVHPDTGDIAIIAEKFSYPIALKVGPDKMAYVPELFGAVYRLSLDGVKREKLAHLPPGLDNLAMTKDGRLFVTNYWEATIYEVATDGSGKFKALFPKGPNTINGIVIKNGRVLVSDGIMIRGVENGLYVPTRINAFTALNMPMIFSLADGPGDQVFWSDGIHNAVAMGDPGKGGFKTIARELSRPVAVLLSKSADKIYVAEYEAGQITEIHLADGVKKVLATGFEGPLALAVLDNTLYVAEGKTGRISKVNLANGNKEIFLAGAVGIVGALGDDGAGNLLALDCAGMRLFRINPKNLTISMIAQNLPVRYALIGNHPPVGVPAAMSVSARGDIYIPTANRGLIMLEKIK